MFYGYTYTTCYSKIEKQSYTQIYTRKKNTTFYGFCLI